MERELYHAEFLDSEDGESSMDNFSEQYRERLIRQFWASGSAQYQDGSVVVDRSYGPAYKTNFTLSGGRFGPISRHFARRNIEKAIGTKLLPGQSIGTEVELK